VRDALTWYLLVQLAALAIWPAVALGLSPLQDRGWAVAKAAGLLAFAWLTWFVCMLTPVPFTRGTLAMAVVVIGAGAWLFQWRTAGLAPLLDWMRQNRLLLGALEAILAAAFVLFTVLRAHEPATAAFEKPMDLAFVNGFMAAQRLPTQDTWLSGYGVPYYYFGYFLAACVGKLGATDPAVA